ncbi:MAG: FeoB-associated Cys-rich membrane protein [Bacteroidales bacterium]|nr:FeoB-associated Cys-rich membrane protein [Bacteroidales bacterium]MBP5412233.1 FeoB-associated Cys-rich membrane protein [Bacteroidales bacterium]
MNAASIIILIVVAIAVSIAGYVTYKRNKQGKCSCGCSNCSAGCNVEQFTDKMKKMDIKQR